MELICPSCQQTLRVGDADAGKQARCPKCQTVFAIPGGNDDLFGSAGSGPDSSTPDSVAPTISNSGELWHLRIEDGRSFGPVPKSELDQWLAENRITSNCFVRRDQESNWMAAGSLYPHLGPAGLATSSPSSSNPFGEQNYGNAYSSPAPHVGAGGYMEPHRGGTVLTFGILGIVCGCCIFGLIAWIMGAGDLKKMDNGTMNPEGRGMTMAGYVLGIIGVILNLLVGGLQVLIAGADF